jgi:hypothetical protein
MSEEKPIGVIACTESDICVGGYGPLPRDRNAFHEAKPDEKPHLDAIFHAWRALQELGWRDAIYAPRDSSPLLLIEAGSTGVHEGYRDDIGFWIYDGDTWPSRPILFKPLDAARRAQPDNEGGHR